MNKFAFRAFCLFGLVVFYVGCGGSDTSSSDNTKAPLVTLNDIGNANSSRNELLNKDAGGAAERSQRPAAPNSRSADEGDVQEGGVESTSFSSNGLFPNIAMGGSSSRFGGGLFPGIDMGEAMKGDAMEGEADKKDMADMSKDADAATDGDAEVVDAEPEPAKKISLLADAKKLFQSHRESDAINVIYVNHLVSDDARDEYPLSWFDGLKEPRLFFRWGVGVVFSQPSNFEGRHPVIGDPGDENETTSGTSGAPARGRGRSRGGGTLGPGDITGSGGGGGPRGSRSGSRTYKNIDTSRPDGFLMYYTGDFGQQLISHLDSRRMDSKPYYGQILKDVMEVEIPEEEQSTTARRPRGGRGLGQPSGSLGIAGDGGGQARGRSNRNREQDEANADVLDRAMGRTTASKPDDEFSGSILPGVELLGAGKKAELVQRARKADVDTMIMFTVKVSKSRGEYFSTTSMKIVDVASEENLFNSKGLKDTKVSEAVEDGDDPVKDEVEKAFVSLADKQFKAANMPKALNEQNVKKRIGRLLKQESNNPLAAAVEIVSFHKAKLLSDDLAKMALKRLFDSDESEILVTGEPKERLEYLKQWLPDGVGDDAS